MGRGRRGSPSLGGRVVSRQLASQPAVVASIFVVVLISAFLLAAAPRLLERVSAEDLRSTVSDPLPAQRNVRVERFGRLGAGPVDDPFRSVRVAGDSFAETELPPSLAAVISDRTFVVESPRFGITPLPGETAPHPFSMLLRFRYQEHIEDHLSLVAGTMPTPQEPVEVLIGNCPDDPGEVERLTDELAALGEDQPEDLPCRLEAVPHFEIAVTAPTAEDLGIEIGRKMVLRPDGNDRLFFGISGQALDYVWVVSISGIVELDDPGLEYWYGDTALHRPVIQENADLRIISATGLMSPDDYETMSAELKEATWNYVWRHFVDADRVAEADVEVLRSELGPFEQHYSPVAARPIDLRVITQLSDLLSQHLSQRAQTVAMISLGVAGLFSVLVAVTLLMAVLMTERQRSALVLARNRGSSPGQLSLTRAYEGLLLSVPAAIIGYWLAAVILPGTDHLFSYRATVAVVAAATTMVVAASAPLLGRRLGDLQGDDAALPGSTAGRRLVAETLVIVLALGALALLTRRGQVEDRAATVGFDLLLAMTPPLVALAGGLLTVRVYPLPITLMAWLGSRWRGLVGFVGFRRILGRNTGSRLGILVIVICVATAAFASVARSSMIAGQETSSWQAVGGDYAIEGFGPDVNLPTSIDLEGLGAAIDDFAYAKSFPTGRAEGETRGVAAHVMAIDADAYRRITRSTPGTVSLPGFMLAEPGPETGTETDPLRVIVSENWPSDLELSPGDVFTLDLGGRLQPRAVVGAVTPRFPDVPADRPFVIVDLSALEEISDLPLPPTVAYLRGNESIEGDLRAGLTAQAPTARLISRYETLRSMTADPFIAWANLALVMVSTFAIAMAGVTVVSAVALGSARRRRDFGFLRTMGLGTGQTVSMTVIEQVPSVAIGTAFGALLGVGTALAIDPVIDLDAFTGDLVPTAVTIDWTGIGLMSMALAAALSAAIVIFVLVNRRQDLGQLLRVGEE